MEKVKIRDLKEGQLFKLKDSDSSPTWIRGEYDRSQKKYRTYKWDDVNHERFLKGDAQVFIYERLKRKSWEISLRY